MAAQFDSPFQKGAEPVPGKKGGEGVYNHNPTPGLTQAGNIDPRIPTKFYCGNEGAKPGKMDSPFSDAQGMGSGIQAQK